MTHAIGAGLSIAGLAVLLVVTGNDPDPWKYVSFSIYGASQILLYLSSAFLHGFPADPRTRAVLSRIDHSLIFVLIAGTYTPACLIALRETVGWTILAIIWGLAVAGIILKTVVLEKPSGLVDVLYIPMGWLAFLFFRQLVAATSPGFVTWIIAGGLCYTLGCIFYAWRKLPFSHLVWHFFVLGGGTCFFLGYLLHVA